MTISLADFLSQITVNPMLAVTVILTLGVILVNGWTDAPNAIATCVSTQAIHPELQNHNGSSFQLPGCSRYDNIQCRGGLDNIQHGGFRR